MTEHVRRSPPSDTPPAVEAVLLEGYRRMTPAERLERVRQLCRAVQELALLDIRRRHPDAAPREVQLRLASRWLDATTMRRVFGWDPDHEGF